MWWLLDERFYVWPMEGRSVLSDRAGGHSGVETVSRKPWAELEPSE